MEAIIYFFSDGAVYPDFAGKLKEFAPEVEAGSFMRMICPDFKAEADYCEFLLDTITINPN